jgi:hypothetical protein
MSCLGTLVVVIEIPEGIEGWGSNHRSIDTEKTVNSTATSLDFCGSEGFTFYV